MVRFNGSLNHFSKKPNTPLTIKGHLLSLLTSLSSPSTTLPQIHSQILTSGLLDDTFLASEFLRFAALSSSPDIPYALSFLFHTPNPISSSFNHVIRGCISRSVAVDAIDVFRAMRASLARPNKLTYPFVVKACAGIADLQLGRQVHADALKTGNDSVVYVQNALISCYGECRKVRDARKVFDFMCVRTIVSWNAILSAFVDNSHAEESIVLFVEMMRSGYDPDETTMVVMLSASAELGNFSLGRWLHSELVAKEFVINIQLGTALVNFYAKCGDVESARLVFDRMLERNVWTWSSMILGFAQHGLARKALELFSRMKEAPVKPNYVTFLGVLCACSHSGLVDCGYQFFNEMMNLYNIKPRMSHYSAMVDVLGRKGRLEEAYRFIEGIPLEVDPVVWRTLLSACNLHKFSDYCGVGAKVRSKLLKLEPRRCGNYVMAANMFAEAGSWEEAAKMRRKIREEGLKKTAGESCIEVGGVVHKFIVGDDTHVYHDDVCIVLKDLNLNMRKVGEEKGFEHGDPYNF